MNIFYLDRDVTKCAEYHNDKHVVKMILEYAQLLSTAHRVLDGKEYIDASSGRKIKRWRLEDTSLEGCLYKATHVNHPSAVWVRQSNNNYNWLVCLFQSLLSEYTHRYGKIHSCDRLVAPGPTSNDQGVGRQRVSRAAESSVQKPKPPRGFGGY